MSNVLIRYIGKQINRLDDVRPGTGRSWAKAGSVVAVPEAEAFSYLAHKSEWEQVSDEQLKAERQAEFQARGGIGTIAEVLPLLSVGLLHELLTMVDVELASRGAPISVEPVRGTDGLSLAAANSERTEQEPPPGISESAEESAAPKISGDKEIDAAAAGGHSEKVQTIVTAIKQLDKKNPEHYTAAGKPRVSALEDKGVKATSAEIEDALKLIINEG